MRLRLRRTGRPHRPRQSHARDLDRPRPRGARRPALPGPAEHRRQDLLRHALRAAAADAGSLRRGRARPRPRRRLATAGARQRGGASRRRRRTAAHPHHDLQRDGPASLRGGAARRARAAARTDGVARGACRGGRHRADRARGGAAAVAEDGGGRAADRRPRARLQQPPDRHLREPRAAESARRSGPVRLRARPLHRRGAGRGEARRDADASPSRVLAAPDARLQGGGRQPADRGPRGAVAPFGGSDGRHRGDRRVGRLDRPRRREPARERGAEPVHQRAGRDAARRPHHDRDGEQVARRSRRPRPRPAARPVPVDLRVPTPAPA